MKFNKYIVAAIIVITNFFVSCFAESYDEELIKKCWEIYKSALLNSSGEVAVDCVDKKTIQYYEYILKAALYFTEKEINLEPMTKRLMIFRIRHQIPSEKIKKMDGKKLLIYSIDNGWVGKNSVMHNDIKNIKINNTFATATIMVNQKETDAIFQFYKEDGKWKMNLISNIEIVEEYLKTQAAAQGYRENEYIFELLFVISSKRVDESILLPIIH